MTSKRKLPESRQPEWIDVKRRLNKRCYDYDDDDEEGGEFREADLKEERGEELPKESHSDEGRLKGKEHNSDAKEAKDPDNGYLHRSRSAVGMKIRTGEVRKLKRKNGLWREEDEIWILKGVREFCDEIALDLNASMDDLYDLVRPYLSSPVSMKQVRNKIGKLKDRYCKNLQRAEHDKDPSFSDPHEQTLFSLSKKIWGTTSEVNDNQPAQKENHHEDRHQDDHNQEDDKEEQGTICWSLYPRLSESLKMEEFSLLTLPVSGVDYTKEMLSCIGNSKAEELEEKWRKLQVAETRVKLMRAELIQYQTKLILNLIK